MTTELITATEGSTRILELHRPEQRNALTPSLLTELAAAMCDADGDPAVRCIVLTGSGSVFCAGADLSLMAEEKTPEQSLAAFRPFVTLFQTVRRLETPVLAAVNGHALAGGLGLALSCDLVIAAESATFGTPEIGIGLWPMMIMSIITPQIGPKRAMELYLTGRRLGADEAKSWGMVNEIVPNGGTRERALALASSLASWSSAIIGRGRHAFMTASGLPFDAALDYLHGEIALLAAGSDAREGARAFLDKRAPHFSSHKPSRRTS